MHHIQYLCKRFAVPVGMRINCRYSCRCGSRTAPTNNVRHSIVNHNTMKMIRHYLIFIQTDIHIIKFQRIPGIFNDTTEIIHMHPAVRHLTEQADLSFCTDRNIKHTRTRIIPSFHPDGATVMFESVVTHYSILTHVKDIL